MDLNEFKDSVVLVTGGSSGIGKSIVSRFASLGANVIFTYSRDEKVAESVLKDLNRNKQNVSAFKSDVRDRKQVCKVMKNIETKYKKLDILVNNAGINKPTDFDKIKDKDWDDVIDVNLKGPFICSQEALYLMKQNGGSIINIGSVSGQYGGPRTAHYAASKAGLISLGQVIARFGAQYNIRCNTLSAGLIESEMAANALQDPSVKKACENIILNRFGTYNEVADSVLFLASSSSKYITAQTLNLNGGLYF